MAPESQAPHKPLTHIELLKGCVLEGDGKCLEEYNKLKDDFSKGLRATEEDKKNIKAVLKEMNIVIDESKNVEEILKEWFDKIPSGSERVAILKNITLRNILSFLIAFVIDPEFSGDPTTMKTSKMWFSTRPNCTDPKRIFSGKSLSVRPTSKKVNFRKDGTIEMVGGGSQNERKNISYVNKIRYLDSLNSYYNMVGGATEPTDYSTDLQKIYESIISNLQLHGKQVENSDNRIIETMLQKFSELESKVKQLHENIAKLSEVAGTNVSEVLQNEKEKLKTVSNYLSTQGKNITSVIRSLFENSSQLPINNKALSNARLQFPQHTVN